MHVEGIDVIYTQTIIKVERTKGRKWIQSGIMISMTCGNDVAILQISNDHIMLCEHNYFSCATMCNLVNGKGIIG